MKSLIAREIVDLAIVQNVCNIKVGLGNPWLEECSESQVLYNRFLYALVHKYKPELVVECGVYMATATAHMALGCENTKIVAIDRDFHPRAYEAVVKFPNIYMMKGDTVASFNRVKMFARGRKIGLIFLDSSHDGITPWNEFNAYFPLFADECMVVCDDIVGNNLSPDDRTGMQQFWEFLPGEKIDLNWLHPAYGGVAEPGFGVSIVRRAEIDS